MAVFWVVAPCSLVEVYQRFNATTQKIAIFVLAAVRTSNPTQAKHRINSVTASGKITIAVLRRFGKFNSVNTVTSLRNRRPGFDFRQGKIFLCRNLETGSGAHPVSRPAGTTVLFSDVQRPGHEAKYSPPSSSDIKNVWSYTSTLTYVCMAWGTIKHQGLLYLYLYAYSALD
jgi:hypothetical protein